jgi:hypothetical protein
MGTQEARLSVAELRQRTDRQLILLARNEITRSLDCAKRNALAEAETRYDSARILVAAARTSEEEFAELAARLETIRASLDRGSALAAAS